MRAPVASRFLIICAIIAAALAIACGSSDAKPLATSPAGLVVIELEYPEGILRVEVAATPSQRAVGLSNRDTLDADAGMLFDLGETRVPSFWMKDTRIPLDMVWIREDRTVAGVTRDVQPEPGVADGDLRRYSSAEPVRYVLELNAGGFDRLGLAEGDAIDFDLPATE